MTLIEMKKIMNEEMGLLVNASAYFRRAELDAESKDREVYKLMRVEYEERAYEVARLMFKFKFITFEEFEQIRNNNTNRIYLEKR